MGTFQLNTGSYWGNGTAAIGGYNGGFGNRVASSTQINRVSRDIAAGYNNDLTIVNEYLQKGETDKALELYENIINDAKTTAMNYGYSLTDSQISSILNNAYSKTTGTSMTTAASENTSSSFMTGVKSGIPIIGLFANGTSDDEALAKLSGTKVSAKDKVKEYAGAIATGAAVGSCFSFPVGTIIGGAVGAAQTFLKDIF